MKTATALTALAFSAFATASVAGPSAGQTAIVLYETMGMETPDRREGLAFVEIDPAAPEFGEILAEIPLPPDMIAHHVFYNPARDRAYVTSLGRTDLLVLDLTATPYRKTWVPVPECVVGEDVTFSAQRNRWYLTCMGSSVIVEGDMETDEVLRVVPTPDPWPHGISARDDLGLLFATSTTDPADETRFGDAVTAFDLDTLEPIGRYSTATEGDGPSGPVEIFFVPGAEVPTAYITNLASGDMTVMHWKEEIGDFHLHQGIDFAALGQSMPLEVYFNEDATRAYVTTAAPGHINILDITDAEHPRHLAAVPAAPGAHHVAFSPDGQIAFVQNGLMNIDGINDGSISVIDLDAAEPIGSIDTFREAGFTVNMIEVMPDAPGGHTH